MTDNVSNIALILSLEKHATIVMYTPLDSAKHGNIAYKASSKSVDMYFKTYAPLTKTPNKLNTPMYVEKMMWANFCKFVVFSSEQMQHQVKTRLQVANGFILFKFS